MILSVREHFRNHPLSIEAIFPTNAEDGFETIEAIRNHPLSIEAIFPTNGGPVQAAEEIM